MCMKLKTIVESIIRESELTTDQNHALKYLYVVLRDILKDVTDEALNAGINKQNFIPWFGSQYSPIFNYHKDRRIKIKKVLPKTLTVELPDELIKILPRVRKTINIVFSIYTTSGAEFNSYRGIHDELVINVEKMLSDFDSYKVSIQHEVQHAIEGGGSPDEDEPNKLVKWIDYLLIPGELNAHAKQYAYKYFKKFPTDGQLDLSRFKTEFCKKGDGKIDNYINFGEDSERLKSQYNLTVDQYKQMVTGYTNFISTLRRSFLYYKQN